VRELTTSHIEQGYNRAMRFPPLFSFTAILALLVTAQSQGLSNSRVVWTRPIAEQIIGFTSDNSGIVTISPSRMSEVERQRLNVGWKTQGSADAYSSDTIRIYDTKNGILKKTATIPGMLSRGEGDIDLKNNTVAIIKTSVGQRTYFDSIHFMNLGDTQKNSDFVFEPRYLNFNQVRFTKNSDFLFLTTECQLIILSLKLKTRTEINLLNCLEGEADWPHIGFSDDQKELVVSNSSGPSLWVNIADMGINTSNPSKPTYRRIENIKRKEVKHSFAGASLISTKYKRILSINRKVWAVTVEDRAGKLLGKIPLPKGSKPSVWYTTPISENVFIQLSPDQNTFSISSRPNPKQLTAETMAEPRIESKFTTIVYSTESLKPIRTITELDGLPIFSRDSKMLVASWYNPQLKQSFMRLVRVR
jgi:hypothetical protein